MQGGKPYTSSRRVFREMKKGSRVADDPGVAKHGLLGSSCGHDVNILKMNTTLNGEDSKERQ